jgi:peptide/nickel transport system ATP-binding protein
MTAPTLRISDLSLGFKGYTGLVRVLHGISLHIEKGERVALVGESGSGKSVTARIVLGLLQALKDGISNGSPPLTATSFAARRCRWFSRTRPRR